MKRTGSDYGAKPFRMWFSNSGLTVPAKKWLKSMESPTMKEKGYMGKHEKLLIKILRGASDANISFSELCNLLTSYSFDERVRGDHHIFTRNDIEEILNLQPIGSKAKPYQVKQIRKIILKYRLNIEVEDA